MSGVQQGLARLRSGFKAVLVGIDLTLQTQSQHLDQNRNRSPLSPEDGEIAAGRGRAHLVLLVPIEESFGSGYVVRQLVCVDQSLHLSHPAGEVPEVCSEALQPENDQSETEW